ncbi:Hypothetical predicted protein [Paramuricea clavata]|uniref:Uncharacterized protein n=1 Tax=Paramuricea clavata TaxID=317549 RepID=A0A6S7K6C6_PARCT|nr:Hypothetical predicted protein [Paramuricea clavata]
MVLFDKDVSKEQVICETCLKLQKRINQQQARKEHTSSAPARDKAPLVACGAEKLRATVIADRVQLKDLRQDLKTSNGK